MANTLASDMRLLVVILSLVAPLSAAVFVPPLEEKALVRRDLLPLDPDRMRDLSGYLTDLARRDGMDGPRQLRSTAQLLAVAIHLDPANRAARDLSRRLAKGEPAGEPDLPTPRALVETWRIVDWLLQPAAGGEGQLLGQHILDALQVVDPPGAQTRSGNEAGEAARWDGVVAELTLFAAKEDEAPTVAPEPAAVSLPPVDRAPIVAREAMVRTPLFLRAEDGRLLLRVVPLAMKVEERESEVPLTFGFEEEVPASWLDSSRRAVADALRSTWEYLPLGELAVLEVAGGRYARPNEGGLSGPAALLLQSALAGTAVRDEVVLLGEVDGEGMLRRPRWSWDYLRALRHDQTGGRLLVPPGMQAELRALLALEDPGFFLKWEVLISATLEDAHRLARRGDEAEGLAATRSLFLDLRARQASGHDPGQLCVEQDVREHLATILTEVPFHYSAAMLLLQGSGQHRPTRIEREVTARILRSAVEPLVGLSLLPVNEVGADRIAATAERVRSEIESFRKRFSEKDFDLRDKALGLLPRAQEWSRARRDGLPDGRGRLFYRDKPLADYQERFRASCNELLEELAPFTAESVAPPPGSEETRP